MYYDAKMDLKSSLRMDVASASSRRATGCTGPLAAPPAKGEAATLSEQATGVSK